MHTPLKIKSIAIRLRLCFQFRTLNYSNPYYVFGPAALPFLPFFFIYIVLFILHFCRCRCCSFYCNLKVVIQLLYFLIPLIYYFHHRHRHRIYY